MHTVWLCAKPYAQKEMHTVWLCAKPYVKRDAHRVALCQTICEKRDAHRVALCQTICEKRCTLCGLVPNHMCKVHTYLYPSHYEAVFLPNRCATWGGSLFLVLCMMVRVPCNSTWRTLLFCFGPMARRYIRHDPQTW